MEIIQKYLKKNIQKSRWQISGSIKDHFAGENGVCEISQTLKRAAQYFRNNKLNSQGCEVGFRLEVPSILLAVYDGQLQKEIHHTVQKGCGITSQQKGDFAAFLSVCEISQTPFSLAKWFLEHPDICYRHLEIFYIRFLLSKSQNTPCKPPITRFLSF